MHHGFWSAYATDHPKYVSGNPYESFIPDYYAFVVDDRLTVTSPEDESEVTLPVTLRWRVEDLIGPIVFEQRIDDLVGNQLADYRTERVRVETPRPATPKAVASRTRQRARRRRRWACPPSSSTAR